MDILGLTLKSEFGVWRFVSSCLAEVAVRTQDVISNGRTVRYQVLYCTYFIAK